MQKITSKILIVATVIAMFPIQSFALDEQIDSMNIHKTEGSQNIKNNEGEKTGNSTLDKVFRDYEDSLDINKDSTRLNKLSKERKNRGDREISDEIRDELIQDRVLKSKKVLLSEDAIKNSNTISEQKDILKELKDSLKENKKGNYRLFIKTTLTEIKLTDLFSFFDRVDLKYVSVMTDGDVYELSFPFNGRLAKFFGKGLDNGEIPLNIFEGIETIKPEIVRGEAQEYLSGETLPELWGQKVIGSHEYQYGLSQQTRIKVGVIDTGIDYTHSDLIGNLDSADGYNFIINSSGANDDHGHGTHVSGIIGGQVNGQGIFGVDSNVQIVPLKVLSANGRGTSYNIARAINFAANNGIRVINISIGTTGSPLNNIVCSAISAAKIKGTISVVAAGNNDTDVSNTYPAGCADSITVGAVDSTLTKATFSNYGSKVDISAPGVGIYSSYMDNSYASMDGTSMASPFVAGVVATILSYNPSYSPDQVKAIITDPANTVPVQSSVNIGRMVNMIKIFNSLGIRSDAVMAGGTPPHVYIPTTFDVSAFNISTNKYELAALITSSGSSIESYSFWDGGVLLSSGSISTYTINITAPTIITVKVTDSMGVSISSNTTLNYTTLLPPTLIVSSVKSGVNKYIISAAGMSSVAGGNIVNYSMLSGTTLVSSGMYANLKVIDITGPTTLTVKVTDSSGLSASKDIVLAYVVPSTTLLPPTLIVSSVKSGVNKYIISAAGMSSVVGGNIVNYSMLSGTTLVSSGMYANLKVLDITGPTTLTVKVTDSSGLSASKDIVLAYDKTPAITTSATRVGINRYSILLYATSNTLSGKIIDYSMWSGSTFIYSGTTATLQEITLSGSMVLTIKATDNSGLSSSKDIILTYEVPPPPGTPPTLDIVAYKIGIGKYLIKMVSISNIVGGTIKNYSVYDGAIIVYSGAFNIANNIIISKTTIMTVKVTDSTGLTTSKNITLIY